MIWKACSVCTQRVECSPNHLIQGAGIRLTSTAIYNNEEKINAISHGIGAVLSLPALIVMVLQALKSGLWTHMLSSIVYGMSLLILYSCSTVLHCVKDPLRMERYEMLDHAAIYVLIAGTYTPLLLISVKGPFGIALLYLIWVLALIGIFLKLRYPGRFMGWSIAQYMGMGWLLVAILPSLRQALPDEGLMWIVGGLFLYGFGCIFYFWRGIRYHHGIWHTFVLAGSACHFIAVYCYVLYV